MSLILRPSAMLCCAFVLASTPTFANQDNAVKASAASSRYHRYRETITEPTYDLANIKRLVKKYQKNEEETTAGIPSSIYSKLSLKAKFTYHAIFGEVTSQVCDVMPKIIDEEKKIFGQLPPSFSYERGWSESQLEFFKTNRSQVISLIRDTIKTRKKVGVNLKNIINEINGVELIPDLVTAYQTNKRDGDLLTVMMLLMNENKYAPFISSASHKKLYGENSDYRSYINFNKDNTKLIIDRATAFYQSKR
jgi:hypothetical protein